MNALPRTCTHTQDHTITHIHTNVHTHRHGAFTHSLNSVCTVFFAVMESQYLGYFGLLCLCQIHNQTQNQTHRQQTPSVKRTRSLNEAKQTSSGTFYLQRRIKKDMSSKYVFLFCCYCFFLLAIFHLGLSSIYFVYVLIL